ncbi:T9SS type A sorting domain-containing protein [bacterium]|nr:T9SS type A sorting domain-containing protein [bacterium]
MKNNTTTILFVFFFLFSTVAQAQSFSKKRSVEGYATINSGTPSITLHWENETKDSAYNIYRRALGSDNWGSPIQSLASTASEYTDNNVEKNKVYEYAIIRTNDEVEPFGNGALLSSFSYIAAGIELETVHQRGEMMVLVSSLIMDSLDTEVKQLQMDLIGDGWNVNLVKISDEDSVESVKQIIEDQYNSDAGLDAVFLLGHIPVPYSGQYCDDPTWTVPPDGHGSSDPNSHCGAWPADAYYGSFGNGWTDAGTSTKGKREANQNFIGDGKFDNIVLPDSIKVAVGRVDLSNLPTFTETEVELTRRYLQKSHDYKYAIKIPERKALIEDNFAGQQEGFASGAWRDFSAQLGPSNIIEADLFTSTKSTDYLFNYVCGAGGYTSCNGLGRTDSFKTNSPAVFNHMFGSFFGDFDIANNIGRASLAAPNNGLIWIWSGRPKWVTHTLAMGETMGDCALRSQNNNYDYGVSFFQNQAHIGLNGDPSIRSSMFQPVSNLNITLNNDKTRVNLSWDHSQASDVTGYYVYWSDSETGPYILLNQTPESNNNFTHYTPEFGTNYYMVRTERLEITSSATYFNLSEGVFNSIDGVERTASVPELSKNYEFAVYPNPAQDVLKLRFADNEHKLVEFCDIQGHVLHSFETREATKTIHVEAYSSGFYIIRVNGVAKRIVIAKN